MTLSTRDSFLKKTKSATSVEPLDSSALTAIDLFNDAPTLVHYFGEAIMRGDVEDAYLLGAGIQQLIDDDCGARRELYRRGVIYLTKSDSSTHQGVGKCLQFVDQVATILQISTKRSREVISVRSQLEDYLVELATSLIAPSATTFGTQQHLLEHARSLLTKLEGCATAIRPSILRLPSCFRSFDQRPDDVVALVDRFEAKFPDRSRQIAIVGVRTSGSYLAPICAASFKHRGFRRVVQTTIRPGWPIEEYGRRALCETIAHNGIIVVVDDPPTSGKSLEIVVDQLRQWVTPNLQSIVLLLGTFENPIVPTGLGEVTFVTLPFAEWDIHRLLAPPAVARAIEVHLARSVESIEPLVSARVTDRGHVTAAFQIRLADSHHGVAEVAVEAEGVGLGYFGRHVLAVARAAPELYPNVFGVTSGICYREFLPSTQRLDLDLDAKKTVAPSVISYIVQRQRALRVDRDSSLMLAGRLPVWEAASNIVGRVFGPFAKLFRPLLVDPAIRQILRVAQPSVPDSRMLRTNWYWQTKSTSLVKIDFAEGPFSHLDLASYDAAFDVAGAAVALEHSTTAAQLRREFERSMGQSLGASKWALLQLVQIWNARRLGQISPTQTRRGASSRVLQSFYSELYLDGLEAPGGPFCSLDLDGVLETSTLGFPTTTMAGALALRSLIAHDFRPIIASGRSASEVMERCRTYQAFGGVAEYGSYVIVPDSNDAICLLSEHDRSCLDAIRQAILQEPSLELDSDFIGIVRTYVYDERGRRKGLTTQTVNRILANADVANQVQTVDGEEQTDFIPRSVSKGHGIRRLINELDGDVNGGNGEAQLEAAFGDSWSDISTFELANFAFAPSNAASQVRKAGAEIQNGKYQRGTAEAVSRLIGHRVGSCDQCRLHALTPHDQELARLLSLQEGGVARLPEMIVSELLRTLKGLLRS